MIQALQRRGHFADTRLQVSHSQPLVKERRVDSQKEEKRAAQNCVPDLAAREENPPVAHVIVCVRRSTIAVASPLITDRIAVPELL